MELSLEQVRSLFSLTDYTRGMEYYCQGRVAGMTSSLVNGLERVSCTVRGTRVYCVHFQDLDSGMLQIGCTCPWFGSMGRCKHVSAAMIAYVMDPPKKTGFTSDWNARQLLQRYLQNGQRETVSPENQVRLVPQLLNHRIPWNDYPSFSFRVGREKLYVVKNIREFLNNVDQGKTVCYGKSLTLDHSIGQFDPRSREIIGLLMNEYGQYRTLEQHSDVREYAPPDYNKNEITLSGDSFDRWFDLLSGEPVEAAVGGSIRFLTGDPEISVRLEKQEECAGVEIVDPAGYRFFGSKKSLYALADNRLLRCSGEFRDRVYPLLELEQPRLRLSYQDLPAFCGCVLPQIRDLVEVEDPEGLLQEYLPEECTPCFYFDMAQDTLLLKLTFRYGDTELSPDAGPEEGKNVKRDIRAENDAMVLAQRYFRGGSGGYTLEGEEAVYSFLTETLDSFRQCGEVYVSDRLRSRRVQSSAVGVGLSVSGGMLSLSMDTGGFPPEELSALYQSLLLRRKYHRLADGRYLKLDGSPYEKLAEMTHMLQLSKRELSGQTIRVPAFRAPYLDSLLSDSEGIQVKRDKKLRGMIRDFKSVSESDFALPPNLEGVLRPYQRTGFQWLKTLESYGFGGVLADEMGLGKTVQVIAYLATVPRETVGCPSLVVCPTSLILNWGEELQRFAPQLSFRLILGPVAERKALRSQGGEADVWVTSYELLRQDIQDYETLDFYACILDEAQHIKNQSTLASRAVKRITSRQRFVLTGTPVENRLSELWNLFDFLMSGYLFSHNTFREKLEKPILKSKNDEAAAQLRRLVQPFLLRRLKKDVLKELPPKEEHVRRIPLSEAERKTYFACVQAVREDLGAEEGKLRILAALTRLRQICCDPNLCFENYDGPESKLDACMELCEAMVENGHQILLFSQFTTMLDRIRQRLEELHITSFTLQGSTPKEKRARLVKAFNAGEASVFLISLKAGGTGLNLTAADVVIHYDPWWNLAAQDQATDRAHRIGQQAHVQVYKLIAQDTIEERILDLQNQKAALLDTVTGMDDGGILNMSREDLLALLESR